MKQIISPEKTIEHLTPESWAKSNLYLIQKALAEFAHEMIINPQLIYEKDGWGTISFLLSTQKQK